LIDQLDAVQRPQLISAMSKRVTSPRLAITSWTASPSDTPGYDLTYKIAEAVGFPYPEFGLDLSDLKPSAGDSSLEIERCDSVAFEFAPVQGLRGFVELWLRGTYFGRRNHNAWHDILAEATNSPMVGQSFSAKQHVMIARKISGE
jgi:hypothetical protein